MRALCIEGYIGYNGSIAQEDNGYDTAQNSGPVFSVIRKQKTWKAVGCLFNNS